MSNIDILSPLKIFEIWNPFEVWGFSGEKVKKKTLRAIKENRFIYHKNADTIKAHAETIAYFYNRGEGFNKPIEFDCGIPGTIAGPYCNDGNHRLAAAILKEEQNIAVFASGALDIIESLKPSYTFNGTYRANEI